MKNEGALKMRFLRHDGIYRSDVSFPLVNSGRGAASRPRTKVASDLVLGSEPPFTSPAGPTGPAQAIGRAGRNAPCPSSAMSSGRLFLDRVARLHRPSPLHRHIQHNSIDRYKETKYHRTVYSVLTVCLTSGGKSRYLLLRTMMEGQRRLICRAFNRWTSSLPHGRTRRRTQCLIDGITAPSPARSYLRNRLPLGDLSLCR